jgi:hypothetical protein
MAKVSVAAAIIRKQFEEKLQNDDHVVLSFVQKGFEISNQIKIDGRREDQKIFIEKKNLIEWSNTEHINNHAIGKSYFFEIDKTFSVRTQQLLGLLRQKTATTITFEVQRGCFKCVKITLTGEEESTEHELPALHRIGVYNSINNTTSKSNETEDYIPEEEDHFQLNKMMETDSEKTESEKYHTKQKMRLVALRKFRNNQKLAIEMYTRRKANGYEREKFVNSKLIRQYYSCYFPLGRVY